MKGSDQFEKTIGEYLEKISMQDSSFEKKFNNPKKSIKKCVTYILNTVKNSNRNGFTDSEIYGMAIHYYDEENIKEGKPLRMKVFVNHKVELTPEEIEKEKQKAREKIYSEVKESIIKKKKVKIEKEDDKKEDKPLTLF